MVSSVSVVMMYIIEIGCLLLSVLGVFGAFKEKRWCLILVKKKKKKSLCIAAVRVGMHMFQFLCH